MQEGIYNFELRTNNPYSIGYIYILPDDQMMLERDPIVPIKSVKDSYYTIREGDTLNSIAFKYYKDSKLYWILLDVNNIENPFELKPGETILIPDYSKLKSI